jgi:hypothetical protein
MTPRCFRVLQQFQDEGSVYCPGLLYTASNERLLLKAETWVRDGKAEWAPHGTKGQVGGRGIVR